MESILKVDICARLPYGVKCKALVYEEKTGNIEETEGVCEGITPNGKVQIRCGCFTYYKTNLKQIKPYLRPLADMTKKEIAELDKIETKALYECIAGEDNGYTLKSMECNVCVIDFCNKHHLDYRGLIEKGLALVAPKDMYNFD